MTSQGKKPEKFEPLEGFVLRGSSHVRTLDSLRIVFAPFASFTLDEKPAVSNTLAKTAVVLRSIFAFEAAAVADKKPEIDALVDTLSRAAFSVRQEEEKLDGSDKQRYRGFIDVPLEAIIVINKSGPLFIEAARLARESHQIGAEHRYADALETVADNMEAAKEQGWMIPHR